MKLLSILQIIYPLSPEVVLFLKDRLTVCHHHKHTLILSAGQICDTIYFVEKGIARGYYQHKDEEITSWFVQEDDFLCSPYSFLRQKPSFESIELLEDSVLVAIPLALLDEVYQRFPETNQIGRVIAEKYLLMYDARLHSLRHHKADEKLANFIEHFPDIFKRAPRKQIATYLGMTAGSLSRALSKKHQRICKNYHL